VSEFRRFSSNKGRVSGDIQTNVDILLLSPHEPRHVRHREFGDEHQRLARQSRAEVAKDSAELFGAVHSGKLKVAIHARELSLAQVADAHRSLESRETTGKILLRI
jgi:NADPH:quinone reductase-like Zn-dependent oxidoreductase